MTKMILYKYIDRCLEENYNRCNDYVIGRIKSLFTTYCIINEVKAHSRECNEILYQTYQISAIQKYMEILAFDAFMTELLTHD